MIVHKDEFGLSISVPSKKDPIKRYLSLVLGLIYALIALFVFVEFIILQNIDLFGKLVSVIFCSLLFYLSYMAYTGFLWHIKGAEIIKLSRDGVEYRKKGLELAYSPIRFKIKDFLNIEIYDKNQHEPYPIPLSDSTVGACGGKIILRYQNQHFLFAKNVSLKEANTIIEEVNSFILKN